MTNKAQTKAQPSRLLTDAHVRYIRATACEVMKGNTEGLALLDEPQLSNAQALANEAESIDALCHAYTDATKERDQLRDVLSALDSFNAFDFDPCTMEELTEIKDRARALIDQFPQASEAAEAQGVMQ